MTLPPASLTVTVISSPGFAFSLATTVSFPVSGSTDAEALSPASAVAPTGNLPPVFSSATVPFGSTSPSTSFREKRVPSGIGAAASLPSLPFVVKDTRDRACSPAATVVSG